MTPLEIALLIGGALIFAISFIIPSGNGEADGDLRKIVEDEVKKKVASEMDSVKSHLDDVVDEAVDYAQEKTERSLERISNEKIMAVNEYSDTVLEEINKNHKEVMFLYDMLNDKHDTLVSTVGEAEKVESGINGQTAEAKKVLDDSLKILEESKKNCDEARENYEKVQTLYAEARQAYEEAREVCDNVWNAGNAAGISEFEGTVDAAEFSEGSDNSVFSDSDDSAADNIAVAELNDDNAFGADGLNENGAAGADDLNDNGAVASDDMNDNAIAGDDLAAADVVNDTKAAQNGAIAFESADFEPLDVEQSYQIYSNAANEENGEEVGVRTQSEVKVRTLKWAAFAKQQADEALSENGQSISNVNIDYPVLPKPARSIASHTDKENSVNPQAQLHNEILTLHKLGQSDVEIARSLNMGVGEVSLIIGLHGNEK